MRNIVRMLFVPLLMVLSVSCVSDNSPAAMKEMVGRLCPEHSNSFRFEYLSDQPDSIDCYSIETYKGKILIKGNTVNSMAVGLNASLRIFVIRGCPGTPLILSRCLRLYLCRRARFRQVQNAPTGSS